MLFFHLAALAAALYHSITWFRLAPMAITLRVRGRRVPGAILVAGHRGRWGAGLPPSDAPRALWGGCVRNRRDGLDRPRCRFPRPSPSAGLRPRRRRLL